MLGTTLIHCHWTGFKMAQHCLILGVQTLAPTPTIGQHCVLQSVGQLCTTLQDHLFHNINCTLCDKLNEKKKYDIYIKFVCVAKTVDCFRVLSRRKWLMQENYDGLLAKTEMLIPHCASVLWHHIWKQVPTIYTNILIKASETLVPSKCTGLILVLEVMAENHHGYNRVIYLGCQVEQTTFLSWITHSIGLSWTSSRPKIIFSGPTAATFLPHRQIHANTY